MDTRRVKKNKDDRGVSLPGSFSVPLLWDLAVIRPRSKPLSPAVGGDYRKTPISTITSIKINDNSPELSIVKLFISRRRTLHLPFSALFYSDFLFFSFFLESLGSSPPSRPRLMCFSRAPSVILPEVGKEWIFLGSSTPAGFMKVVDVEVIAFFRVGARRSVPTPPLSKMACLAVFASFGSKPLSCPDVPEADIEMGLRCIFRFEDASEEASGVVGESGSWTTSGVGA